MATPHDIARSKNVFAKAKEDHKEYGHDLWVTLAVVDDHRSVTFIYNVCADVACPKKGEHLWTRTLHKKLPAMKCVICDFLWQPHMNKPKVTCEQILNNPKTRLGNG